MKGAWIMLSIAVALLALFLSRAQVWARRSTIDIHVHDTYFIFTYFFFALFVFFFLGTFFALGGMIGTTFRNKYFLIASVFFVVADIYFIIQYLNWFR